MNSDQPGRDELREIREQLARLYDQLMQAGQRLERLERRAAGEPGEVTAPSGGPEPSPLTADGITADGVIAAGVDVSLVAEIVADESPREPPRTGSPFAVSAAGHPVAAGLGSGDRWSWESVVGGRWMTWLGAFTLILAVAFFIPWAWQHFQMAAWLRVLIFHLGGVALLALGHWLDRREMKVFAQGLAGIGIFTLFASAYAAEYLYEIWGSYGELVTLVECAALTVLAMFIAVRANSAAVIVLGALGGYLTPVIASSGSGNHAALFSYLAFLNVALIGCAVIRGWSFLKPLVLIATALMFFSWLDSSRFDDTTVWSTQWFVVLHFVILLAGTTLPPVVWKRSSAVPDLLALTGGSLWFVGATWIIFHNRIDQQLALVCWVMSVLHLLLFAVTHARVSHVDRMPRVHLALAALLFTLAAPLQMEDSLNYLALAWSAQGLTFTTVGVYFRDRQMCASALLVFALATLQLFAFDYVASPDYIAGTSIDLRLVMFLSTAICAMLAGGMYWVIGRALRRHDSDPVFWLPAGASLAAAGNVLGMIGLTCQWDSRLILLLWTLDAALLWAAGFYFDRIALRWYACLLAVGMVGARILYHGDRLFADSSPLANDRFGTLLLVAVVYLAAGWMYRVRRMRRGDRVDYFMPVDLRAAESYLAHVLGILANVILVVAISLEIDHAYDLARRSNFQPFPNMQMAEMATYSIMWAIYAALLITAGFVLRYQLFRIIGLLAFLPILVKVFFNDLGFLELMPRILALAVLGMTLLGVSFLYQKFTSRLDGSAGGS